MICFFFWSQVIGLGFGFADSIDDNMLIEVKSAHLSQIKAHLCLDYSRPKHPHFAFFCVVTFNALSFFQAFRSIPELRVIELANNESITNQMIYTLCKHSPKLEAVTEYVFCANHSQM